MADWLQGGWTRIRAGAATQLAPALYQQQFREWAAEQGLPATGEGYQQTVQAWQRFREEAGRR